MTNEKRLIDANALLEEIKRIYTEHYEKSAYKFIHDFFRAMIRRVGIAPTVDAVEVVHGRMVEVIPDHECPWYKVLECSLCGNRGEIWYNYCPNCGAKMDMEVDA